MISFYQSCSYNLNFKGGISSPSNSSGDGTIFGGMQSLYFTSIRNYEPTNGNLSDARYFRLLPGNQCTSGSGSLVDSHDGAILIESGQINYYPSQCVSSPQILSSVPLSFYDPERFIYLDGIYEAHATSPDPASFPYYAKVFCRNSGLANEGFDVVIHESAISQASPTVVSVGTDLTQDPWVSQGRASMSLAAISSADGLSAVYKMTEDTSNLFHAWGQSINNLPDNSLYTFSVFAKSAGRNVSLNIARKDGQFDSCRFDLTNGVVGTSCTANLSTEISIEPYPNGWYRIWANYNVMSGTITPVFYFELVDDSFTPLYQGDGTSGVYLSNARVETGPVPSLGTAFSASIVMGQRDQDGQYRSRSVSPFEVRDQRGSGLLSFGSDIYLFDLDIQDLISPGSQSAHVKTTIDNRPYDLDLSCWVEND